MKRIVLIFTAIIACCAMAYSQKIRTVSATYTYYAPETMSVEEAKRTALERAKIQAIADEFGTLVSQSTATTISTKNGESDTQFFSVGGSEIKGEWIETVGQPVYDVSYQSNQLIVKVNVKGKARSIEGPKIDLNVKILRNGKTERYESDTFKEGDDLYMLFQSPVDGYLQVYLIDYPEDMVYCLLPYLKSTDYAQKINRGEKYLFFSASNADRTVDEYTLNCGDENMAQNEIVTIFSTNEITPVNAEISGENIPRNISLKKFNTWKSQHYKTNNITTTNHLITITKQ